MTTTTWISPGMISVNTWSRPLLFDFTDATIRWVLAISYITWALWRPKSPATLLFLQQLLEATNKQISSASLVRITFWWKATVVQMDSPGKAFPCHNVIMCYSCHYNDVIMGATTSLKSPALRLFTQPFIQMKIKENIKAPLHWPLCGELPGNRWIARTKGQ